MQILSELIGGGKKEILSRARSCGALAFSSPPSAPVQVKMLVLIMESAKIPVDNTVCSKTNELVP